MTKEKIDPRLRGVAIAQSANRYFIISVDDNATKCDFLCVNLTKKDVAIMLGQALKSLMDELEK